MPVNRSPLGKYAQAVAAVIAIAVIFSWILATFLAGLGVISDGPTAGLKEIALIAIGAVFGSAAAINGVKEPIEAAHQRIDHLETGTGISTHGAYPVAPAPDPPG